MAPQLSTGELRYEKRDRRLSSWRSAVPWTAFVVSLLAPGVLLAAFALLPQGGSWRPSPAWTRAYLAVLIGGPPVGLSLGITGLLLWPRRHFWAAVAATCVSALMLPLTAVLLYGLFY